MYPMKVFLCIIFSIGYLFAWGNTGHRVVGKIAEERLSNKAKRQIKNIIGHHDLAYFCLLYTSPSPRDRTRSRMPSSA